MHLVVDASAAAGRLAGTIPFRTVSDRSDFDLSPFIALHSYIAATWPLVHDSCSWETVSEGSLLLTIHGADRSLDPALLAAHLDVVPVEDEESPLWIHPPWSGRIADGRIWGRGSLDYKSGLSAILEACELLLESGFRPARTIILAFGHDEEVGGTRGAASIVELLRSRGITSCRFVLDEGGYVYSFPWMKFETAVIGLAEKGYATIEISAEGVQGHASRPAARTPVGLVGEAVGLLERENTPIRLCQPVESMIGATGRFFSDYTGTPDPAGYAEYMSRWPEGNAMVRTTLAPTVTRGSLRENVIPARASTLVNYRIVPGESVGSTLARVRSILEDVDVRIEIPDEDSLAEPSQLSPTGNSVWNAITGSLTRLLPDVIVCPGIFVASTDSKHYGKLTDRVYRIIPLKLGEHGMGALHCAGESISCDDYIRCVSFFIEVLEKTCG
jgi:carboxypeptidase PM20D1